MKITVVVGSHRNDSQSSKVGTYIQQTIDKHPLSPASFLLDLKGSPLPFWSEDFWEDDNENIKLWEPYSEELSSSDGFVIISPEWGGMVPSGLKNFFLLCADHELAYKPTLLVSVSASRGGAYPIAELRMSSYKNTFIHYLPEHIIVRNVKDVLNEGEATEKADLYIRDRIHHGVNILLHHTEALTSVREKKLHDFEAYPYGM